MDVNFHVDGSADAAWHLVLTHGAGAGVNSPFMTTFATGLSTGGGKAGGIRCLRFEFPYMRRTHARGRRLPPDNLAILQGAWQDAIARVRDNLLPEQHLAIGGKSMGGRIATMIADQSPAEAAVVLGYPFHPAGHPERTRIAHLAGLETPTLLLQGTRDALGNQQEVTAYRLSPAVQVKWLPDGDHGFSPRRRAGTTEEANFAMAIDHIIGFLETLARAAQGK